MSTHKSLKSDRFPKLRTVRKRYERIAKLQRNLKWLEKNQSVYHLPKEKIIRLKYKIKKEIEEKKSLVDYALSLPSKAESTKKKKTSRDDRETTRR